MHNKYSLRLFCNPKLNFQISFILSFVPEESFYQKVYKVVKRIPKGRVLTYQDVAREAGSPGAFRAVGTAMKRNPNSNVIPCHRVVGSDGTMHGYAYGGIGAKIEMLKKEGIHFKGDRIDLKVSRWRV